MNTSRAAARSVGIIVDIFERTLGVEEYQREQLQRHDEHDPPEAVDIRYGDSDILEKCSDDTASAQQKDPGVSADKRCGHGCHDDQDVQQRFSFYLINGEDIG